MKSAIIALLLLASVRAEIPKISRQIQSLGSESDFTDSESLWSASDSTASESDDSKAKDDVTEAVPKAQSLWRKGMGRLRSMPQLLKIKSFPTPSSTKMLPEKSKSASSLPTALVEPPSSTNKAVLQIKNDFRPHWDKLAQTCHEIERGTECLPAYPYEKLSDACKMIIAEVFDKPMNSENFRSDVLKMLGETVGGGKVSEPVAYMAAILTHVHQSAGQVLLNHLNRRLFAGFGNDPLDEQEFEDMREEAIRLVGDTQKVRKLAMSEKMERSLRSMAFSDCAGIENFNNLAALLLKYVTPNLRNPSRSYNKDVWIVAFATVLKLTVEHENWAPEEILKFFYKKGRFAEVYERLFQRKMRN